MALILLGVSFVGISVAVLIENEHHNTILEQNRMQAVTYLYGIEQNILSEQASSPLEFKEILNRSIQHRKADLGFTVFQISMLNSDGETIAKTDSNDTGIHKIKEVSNAQLTGMATHHVTLLKSNDKKFVGGDIQYFHDAETNKKIATMTVSIPTQLTVGEGQYILSASLDLNKTMDLIDRSDRVFENTLLLSFGLGLIILYFFINFAVQKSLITPVRKIAKVTAGISKGNFADRIGNLCCPELQHLGNSIDTMAESIETLISEQETAYLQSLKSLMKALEAKDPYTAKHSARVAKFSVLLGKHIGLAPVELKMLEKGALMHDLGKIGVPDHVLNKPSSLNDAEFIEMKTHPVTTAKIMKPLTRFKEFAQIAAWHHERWDGKGYPDGLSGEAIPLLARIVCIADAWDAMTGDRIYRKGMEIDIALNILEKEKDNGQWDPVLIRAFILLISKQNIEPSQTEKQRLLA